MKSETYFYLMPKILDGLKDALPAMSKAIKKPSARYMETILEVDGVLDRLTCNTKTGELWAEVRLAKSGIVNLNGFGNHWAFCEDYEIVRIPLPGFLLNNDENLEAPPS